MEEKNKDIDQSWKEEVLKEKENLKKDESFIPPAADFTFFITTLSLQASIFLGLIPHPVSNKMEEDLNQAKFIIDTLDMLKEKTKGNLTKDESEAIENVVYELKMQYINKSQGKASD